MHIVTFKRRADKQLQVIRNFKTVIPLRNQRIKPFYVNYYACTYYA